MLSHSERPIQLTRKKKILYFGFQYCRWDVGIDQDIHIGARYLPTASVLGAPVSSP